MVTYPKRIMIFLIVVFLLLFGCGVQRQAIPSYQYFIVDSVYGNNVYTFIIKDPDPRVEYLFPTGATEYPINYDHYVRIYYKQDSMDWIKNDTLILVKKSPIRKDE